MSDGLFTMVNLFGAMANGPSNCGKRKDGLICTAQAGECRHNSRYYSLGMRDQKSWSMPCADETCTKQCGYLQANGRDMGSSTERMERVGKMMSEMAEQERAKKAQAALLLGSLGLDPRDLLDE